MKNIQIILAIMLFASACKSEPTYDAQGTFETTEITISAEGTGKMLSLNVEQGDSISAGQVLGLIDTLQLALQRNEILTQRNALISSLPDIKAQIASLREQIAGKTTDRDRIMRLLADGAATQQQLDNLNTSIASLEAQLKAQISTLQNNTATINQQALAIDDKVAIINDQISRCIIKSPIDGTVIAKIAEPGEVTAYGKPLLKVADLCNMYLRAYFTSDQLSNLKIGQNVKVVAVYGGDEEREYKGEIVFISPQSEFTPKTIQTKDSRANLVYAVKIAVKNDGFIKIGLTGNVYVDH